MAVVPKVLILTGYGINSDYELAQCFMFAGAAAERVHINDLIDKRRAMDEFDILGIPGGFSFGDHIASGRIMANKINCHLRNTLEDFVHQGKLIIGICNGFQVLVKMGLLPGLSRDGAQDATLTFNDSGRFEDRWCTVSARPNSTCIWTRGLDLMELPVRHGEGKFVACSQTILKQMESRGQICLQYAAPDGGPAQGYPQNPNGSVMDIAGLCDVSGRIFGLMPHPEVFIHATNHPRWQREGRSGWGDGMKIFRNGVNFVLNKH